MEKEHFIPDTREEAEQFDLLLSKYVSQKAQDLGTPISLGTAYDLFQKRSDGGRLFAALFDIQINFRLLACDIYNLTEVWNKYFSKGKLEGGSILDSEEKFLGKMEIHHYSSSIIFRYRALWDKVMGFIVLLFAPKHDKEFRKARTRKKKFQELASNNEIIPQIDSEFVNDLCKRIEDFDERFRTPEAHDTGRLRKYSLMMSTENNPSLELFYYWNRLNSILAQIGQHLTVTEEY